VGRRHLVILLALSAIWGASFMFIKIGVREFEPASLIFVRIALAALTLLPIVALRVPLRAASAQLLAVAGPLAVMGLLNSAVPFWLISWAEIRIDSGVAAILQASAPLFTALLAWRLSRSERVTGGRLAGVLVGFVGVAVLVGGVPGGSGSELLACLAVVASALCYAAAALYASARLADVPPLLTATGTMLAAMLLTAPAGIAQLPRELPGWEALASVAALGIGGTGIAYILYFGLIAGAGASRAILVTYLVPALALLYGVGLLGEPLTVVAVGGLALVLAGVALGTGSVALPRRRPTPAEAGSVGRG
jgi:drug/metabolite transporter (DMT)-like permease